MVWIPSALGQFFLKVQPIYNDGLHVNGRGSAVLQEKEWLRGWKSGSTRQRGVGR